MATQRYLQMVNFNSRPCGRGFETNSARLNRAQNFNSRPCGRGFRQACSYIDYCTMISIHAPAGGASRSHEKVLDLSNNFNSRPCGRGFEYRLQGEIQSGVYFNSRPCGRGFDVVLRLIFSCLFQFTPLREGLRVHYTFRNCRKYFNSRPCGRGFK